MLILYFTREISLQEIKSKPKWKCNRFHGIPFRPETRTRTVLKAVPTGLATNDKDNLPKDHGNYVAQECELCNAVYEAYVACDERKCDQLAKATKTQVSKLWQDQRKIRITSSG